MARHKWSSTLGLIGYGGGGGAEEGREEEGGANERRVMRVSSTPGRYSTSSHCPKNWHVHANTAPSNLTTSRQHQESGGEGQRSTPRYALGSIPPISSTAFGTKTSAIYFRNYSTRTFLGKRDTFLPMKSGPPRRRLLLHQKYIDALFDEPRRDRAIWLSSCLVRTGLSSKSKTFNLSFITFIVPSSSAP